jgi:hypothetical protein
LEITMTDEKSQEAGVVVEVKPRADVHKPSSIIPEDYEFVAQEYMKIFSFGDCVVVQQERERIKAHMARTGGTYSGHEHGGNCMVCGSVMALYTALFYHQKTNSYVRMGQDCAEKCDMGDMDAFRSFRAGIKDARDLHTGKAKAQALLADHGLERAWPIHLDICKDDKYFNQPQEERTIADVVEKLVKYGSLSDKQFGLIKSLLQRIDTRAERLAQREAERAAAKPCPTGRIEIAGTVLSTKYQPSDYAPGGEVLKMTVKSDEGWVCYGSVPSCLHLFQDGEAQRGLKHGDLVKFSATLTPSDRDNKFGFFKRPTNAVRI